MTGARSAIAPGFGAIPLQLIAPLNRQDIFSNQLINKNKKGLNQQKLKDLMEDEKHTHTPMHYQRIMNYMIMSRSDGIIN